ncbi:response regulator transcription factor [Egicoccus sp. AB-alg2]|uniref:response regulator transcription factor n=1 Tax=Egicoccus sp. AB-alg2 TaxID=3242693 RepID=UPI00359DBF76
MSEPTRILIVDDDPQFREIVRLVLRRAPDFEFVGEAGDGQAGVEAVERLRPDVVLLDLMMPVVDGFAALPMIRAAHPDAAVIILTALDAEEAAEGMLLGAAGFVEKRHIADRLESLVRVCAEVRQNG